jgi:putative membrane protein
MALEAALAYAHLLAILSWVVFIASTTALTREGWFNAAALARLARVDRLAGVAAIAVLISGLARMAWGAKGFGWYLNQPLLWAKLALWLVLVAVGVGASRRIQAWHRARVAGATLPPLAEVAALRRRVVGVSHLLVVIPALAVCLARGIGVR